MAPLVRGLAPGRPLLVPTIGQNQRAAAGEDLARLLGPDARPVPDLKTALDMVRAPAANGAPVLVCGSLYLLTEFFNLFPDALSGPRACARAGIFCRARRNRASVSAARL